MTANAVGWAFLGIAIFFLLRTARLDRRLQRFRAPEAPASWRSAAALAEGQANPKARSVTEPSAGEALRTLARLFRGDVTNDTTATFFNVHIARMPCTLRSTTNTLKPR